MIDFSKVALKLEKAGQVVTTSEGVKMTKKLKNAVAYIECAVNDLSDIKTLFNKAIQVAIQKKKRRKSGLLDSVDESRYIDFDVII